MKPMNLLILVNLQEVHTICYNNCTKLDTIIYKCVVDLHVSAFFNHLREGTG